MTITRTISTLAVDTTLIDAADVTTVDQQLLTLINNLENGIDGSEKLRLVEIATPASPAASGVYIYAKSDHSVYKKTPAGVESLLEAGSIYPLTPQGRLTLTSGTPVSSADVTAATTVYYTPYGGNQITLYDGSAWQRYSFSEQSLSIAGLAASLPRDVFIANNSGVWDFLTVGWTNTTTRATALALQDGVLVYSGQPKYRYLGTICTTSTLGQTEDSKLNRLVWNYYNRVSLPLKVIEATDSWTYTTATFRPWNNSTTNRVTFVVGVAEEEVSLTFACVISMTAASGAIGIGLDSTTAFTGLASLSTTTTNTTTVAIYKEITGIGSHFLQLLELGGTTVTFRGDNGGAQMQSGALGSVRA